MHVPNRVRVMPHIAVNIHAAIVWLAPRAPSPPSEFPALSVIDISGAKSVLPT
jgi:hypothetical protein